MTNEAIDDAQKQDPGSALVVLYDLEYAEGSFLYFYPGGYDNASLSDKVQFRDISGTVRTYEPFPIEVEGFDISSDGSYNRPTVTMANLENTLRTVIDGDFESLIGKKMSRRTTFQRYLVGESGDSGEGNAPVELPKQVFIIDRIKSKNVMLVEFELATPYDLAGIQLPRRVIVGGACPFKYKGAQDSLDFYDRVGGCDWESKFRQSTENIFMTREDEYIVNTTFTAWSSGTANRGEYFSTTETTPAGFYKVNSSGVLSASNRVNYWQCLVDNTSTAPSDSERIKWRRVRKYAGTYVTSGQYNAYKDPQFNDYVLHSGVLWKVKLTQDANNHQPIKEGPYWTAGDVCGKSLASCRLRFYAKVHETIPTAVSASANKSQISLPFGGFPGAVQRR